MAHCYISAKPKSLEHVGWISGLNPRSFQWLLEHPERYTRTLIFRLPMKNPPFEDVCYYDLDNQQWLNLDEFPYISYEELLHVGCFPYEAYYLGYSDGLEGRKFREPDLDLYKIGYNDAVSDCGLKYLMRLKDNI